jgi:maleate isomerase
MGSESALGLLTAERAGLTGLRHIGVLVPWANTVVEAELPTLAAGRLVFHFARLVPAGRGTALDDGFLDGLRAAIPDALASLEALPLAGSLLACTSAGFTAKDATPGVVSAFDAILDALTGLKARRIALATPYPHLTAAAEAAAFTAAGITVTGLASLGQADDFDRITTGQTRALIEALSPDELADASVLVLSCTNWPTLALIADLEAELGMPVLSSNLALAIAACALGERDRR